MKQCYCYKEECPYLDKTHSILIWYQDFTLGGLKRYKKMEYQCDLIKQCPTQYQEKHCPIYIKAPNEPELYYLNSVH